jgi:hypothetical protein
MPELIVKGKRISCPPQYGYRDHTNRALRLEHGFPLIRSLRASAQRSTSVLFSFVLSLVIVDGSFAIRQSKMIHHAERIRPDLQAGKAQRASLSRRRDVSGDQSENACSAIPSGAPKQKERATKADWHFSEKPIHLTGAEGCAPEQKVETGWLSAKALRAHPEAVWQLVRAR